MKNEYGEIINNDEIKLIVSKIRKLSFEQIDNLWFNCGWIESNIDENYKALSLKRIKEIKNNNKLAFQYVNNLILETPKRLILKNLSKIENNSNFSQKHHLIY